MKSLLIISAFLLSAVSSYHIDRTCGINEVYSPCTQLCPPTCENQNPNCRVDCGRPSCNCAQGYVYLNGRCVPGNSCYIQAGRCRADIDCRHGNCCNGGFCSIRSYGVHTRTVVTSSSSSHHSHSIRGGCSLDVHCPHMKICINGHCVLSN